MKIEAHQLGRQEETCELHPASHPGEAVIWGWASRLLARGLILAGHRSTSAHSGCALLQPKAFETAVGFTVLSLLWAAVPAFFPTVPGHSLHALDSDLQGWKLGTQNPGPDLQQPCFDACWAVWMWCLDKAQQMLVKGQEGGESQQEQHSIQLFPWELRPMPPLTAAQLCSAGALPLADPWG